MPSQHIVREVATPRTFRVSQVASMFDVPIEEKARQEWQADLPIEGKDWQIGAIVGPSGSGKSTVAKEFWPDHYIRGYQWDDRAVVDNFPASMESKAVVNALTAVGFSSPPNWIKPYGVLSTGQQMRCDLARALVADGLVVFDEFTSVVDRTVAQVGSAALAKAVRRTPGKQFVAVTCHADVIDWLAPDWVFEPATNNFYWRYLQRPQISLDVYPVHRKAWPLYRPYHYMNGSLNPTARCYVAEWQGVPVAFMAVLSVIGFKGAYRSTRTVVFPDYQGIGIGVALSEFIAQHYTDQGFRFRRTIAHPAFIGSHSKSDKWKLVSVQKQGNGAHTSARGPAGGGHAATSAGRAVVTFEYIGNKKHEQC